MGTPSNKGLLLDEKTIKTYFWGALPYRHEWMLNRCPQLTSDEAKRLKNYEPQVEKYGKNWPETLGSMETQDYLFIVKKRAESYACMAAMEEQARTAAYQKFFGSKPAGAYAK